MTEQWGYGQQMMAMQAGGQQIIGMPAGGQQMIMSGQGGGQYVVCMMPMAYVSGQGGGQAMAPGQSFAFQQDGGMQQMWMQPQMPMQAASAGGAASAAGARQGTAGASFQPAAQASGAAASGGKEAKGFDPSVASFVPAAQKQQQQAQQEAAGGSPSSFQMSAGAKAFVLPVEQRTMQGMANGRFQGGSAAGGCSGLGPGAGWGLQHAQGVAEHTQSAAAPAARPNAADARGWTRTPTSAAPVPFFRNAGVDAAPVDADAGSPLHKSTDGKAYVPPHLRNRPAPQAAQDGAARKEEPKPHAAKREEEPKPLAAAEFPSLISAVAPKKSPAKKSGAVAREDDAEAAKPEKKPEEEEPVLRVRGTAWGKDAAKEREEAAKKRREEEEAARAAQEVAAAEREAAEQEAAARSARAAQEAAARRAAEQEAAELSQPAEPTDPPGRGPAAAAQPAEARPVHEEAAAAEEEAAPEPEAKGDGKGGGELAADVSANADTNDEGGETNGEETNDEASRPETDVSGPDADAESPSKEETKAEEATTAEPPAVEEAPQEPAAGVLGGIFASKGKKKLKNLAAPRPAAGDGAARAAEEEAAVAERARLEEEQAERERLRAEKEQAAERARQEEEEERRRAEEAKELERDSEDRETEEGTEDMEAATDEVEAASADGEAASDEGEEHPCPHAALLVFRACDGGAEPPDEVATLSAKDDPTGWKPEETPSGVSRATSWRRTAEDGRAGDRGDRRGDRDRKGGGRSGGKDWERPPRETLAALSNKAEHAYKRNTSELDREAELTRCAKSLLNKICPDNCSVIASRIATEAMVDTEEELKIVIHLIFQKALTEPHYCETYVELVHALKGEMPEFPNPDGGKPLTFKAALLNVTQEEYETMTSNTLQPTDEEKANKDPEELRHLMGEKKKKLLANMKFIGHLFLRELLGGKVITSVASELLKINDTGLPEEHVVECVCELISAIGYTLDNSKFQSTLVQVCSRLKDLKGQKNKAGKDILSKRIQFQIQDLLDMRANGWQKKTFKAAAKTKEEIRAEAERDERLKERGRDVPTAEVVIAGKKTPTARDSASAASGFAVEGGAWDVVKTKSRR